MILSAPSFTSDLGAQIPEQLALFGAPPAFSETRHVGQPNIGDREALFERFTSVLERRRLTNNGPFVGEFEARVADYLGVRHCIAMSNGTVALEITARSLGLTGEVIVPSFTFVATPHSLQWQEITPIFCDIDPSTHNIDPAQIKRLITPRTTGILGVHLWGRPCAVEALERIARAHGLQLFFDASHAFGAGYNGQMIGNFGQAEVFSFHATKFVNTFEGGAVVTNDDALAERLRLMKNFGFAGLDNVIYIGTNGKMNEMSAAMGLTSLDSIDSFIAVNRSNYATYRRELADIPGLRLCTYDEHERNNYQYIIVEIDSKESRLSRDTLMRVLHAENVRARRYFWPGSHRMEPYRSYYPNAGLLLPETERLVERVLCLPTGTGVDAADIKKIASIIRTAVHHADEIEANLHGDGAPRLTWPRPPHTHPPTEA